MLIVVPGFIVGGSAPIACTTVPPPTGICASAAPGSTAGGSIASTRARIILTMGLASHDRVDGGLERAGGRGQPRIDGGHRRLVSLARQILEESRLARRFGRRGPSA